MINFPRSRYAPSSSIRSPYSVAALVCAAALTLSACSSAEDDATANPQQDTTQEAQPTKNAEEQKKEQAQKLAQSYSAVLDGADAGDYSLVHIDDSGHPALLVREHNPSEITTIRVHYPTDDLTSTTMLEHELADGAAGAGSSRAPADQCRPQRLAAKIVAVKFAGPQSRTLRACRRHHAQGRPRMEFQFCGDSGLVQRCRASNYLVGSLGA